MTADADADVDGDVREAYLSLVQEVLLGSFAPREELIAAPRSGRRRAIDRILSARGLQLARRHVEAAADVQAGAIWPRHALTMIGRPRLDNARACIERVIADGVSGDIIETGVWRGGASIYMRAVLRAWGVTDRTVWVADSFVGLPVNDPKNYPADAAAMPLYEFNDVLGVSLEEVRRNFASLQLLDEQVRFLEGFFKDTLPELTDERWAVLRLDGDLYESTIQALDALYPNLSVGGWVIVDDYGWLPECKAAVTDFRERHAISDPIELADSTGVFWQRSG
ncbi:MAG: TylF/MycF family methyltransferase [Actinomycetota bacterium]|nr:TylF/MycF family methyltransferase [Actinomycetota bacterium]